MNFCWMETCLYLNTLKTIRIYYSACPPFTKNHERIQQFKETSNSNYIYENELDKACFVHDTAYADGKDLAQRTASDKIFKDRAYEIAINSKYD